MQIKPIAWEDSDKIFLISLSQNSLTTCDYDPIKQNVSKYNWVPIYYMTPMKLK